MISGKFKTQRGFTLIELMVVMSIISMLASVVLVSLNSARDKAKVGNGQQFDASMYHAFGADATGIWGLDESATPSRDISGNGNDLTWTGSITSDSLGLRNTALVFNGSSYLVNTSPKGLPSLTTGVTFSAWVKHSCTSNCFVIAGGPNSGNVGEAALGIIGTTNYVSFDSNGTSPNNNAVNNVAIKPGVWTHIAATASGGTVRFYVNGALTQTKPILFDSPGPWTRIAVGAWVTGGVNFTGSIDEPRIYTQVLSANEIQRIYADSVAKHTLAVAE